MGKNALTGMELPAVHESGHAVVALQIGFRVEHMSVVPRDNRSGEIRLVGGDLSWRSNPVGSIAFLVAGRCSELLATNRPFDDLVSGLWGEAFEDRAEVERIATERLGWKGEKRSAITIIASNVFEFLSEPIAQKVLIPLADELIARRTLKWKQIKPHWCRNRAPAFERQRWIEKLLKWPGT